MSSSAAIPSIVQSGNARDVPATLLARIRDVWNPEEIWLFGSRARGQQRLDSDWDLLVVVDDNTAEELLDPCAAWLRVRDLKLPVDLFAVRREEFDAMRDHLGSLPFIATHEGSRVDAC